LHAETIGEVWHQVGIKKNIALLLKHCFLKPWGHIGHALTQAVLKSRNLFYCKRYHANPIYILMTVGVGGIKMVKRMGEYNYEID